MERRNRETRQRKSMYEMFLGFRLRGFSGTGEGTGGGTREGRDGDGDGKREEMERFL